jgi:hypothetical protein
VGRSREELVIVVKKPGSRIVSRVPLKGFNRVVFVYNRQFTNAPNTTQIASGAGKSSAAGSNAAIGSKNTWQQESVGAGGKASNKGDLPGRSSGKHGHGGKHGSKREKEAVIVVNDQVVKLAKGSRQSSATQVACGGGRHSAGGTNAAIESKGTRQQQAVGGGSGGVGANKLAGKSKKGRPKA